MTFRTCPSVSFIILVVARERKERQGEGEGRDWGGKRKTTDEYFLD